MEFMPGPGVKRARVEKPSIADMKAKPADPVNIQACFAITQFKSKAWLDALDGVTLKRYVSFIESEKNIDRQFCGTIDFIAEYAAVKD